MNRKEQTGTIELSMKAKQLQKFIMDTGIDPSVKELLESTRIAKHAVNALGCEVALIAKTNNRLHLILIVF